MVKAIIFDCWGTLFTVDRTPHQFDEFATRLGYTPSDRTFLKPFERHLMEHAYGDLLVPVRGLLEELGIPYTQPLLDELRDILIDSIAHQIAYPDTLGTLNRLKGKYFLVLLTNSFSQGFEGLNEKFDLDTTFNVIVTSFETHHIKPDLQIFETALAGIPYQPSEIVMVGDNLHDDIEPAQRLGMKAFLLDRRNRYPGYGKRASSLSEVVTGIKEA